MPATEQAPELGGWSESADHAGARSRVQPGAGVSVAAVTASTRRIFASRDTSRTSSALRAEFEFILRHLPERGAAARYGRGRHVVDGAAGAARADAASRSTSPTISSWRICFRLRARRTHSSTSTCTRRSLPTRRSTSSPRSTPCITRSGSMSSRPTSRGCSSRAACWDSSSRTCRTRRRRPRSARRRARLGINENVHTVERWHEAFTRCGPDARGVLAQRFVQRGVPQAAFVPDGSDRAVDTRWRASTLDPAGVARKRDSRAGRRSRSPSRSKAAAARPGRAGDRCRCD